MSRRVFLSWSGRKSKAVAQALRHWLPTVLPGIEPWMSEHDIQSGEAWFHRLLEELAAHDVGVLCVTGVNQRAPWLLFEAGALASRGDRGRIHALLLDLNHRALVWPLAGYQTADYSLAGVLKLVCDLNDQLSPHCLPDEQAAENVRAEWPVLSDLVAREPAEYPALSAMLFAPATPLIIVHSEIYGNFLQAGDALAIHNVTELVERYGSEYVRNNYQVRVASSLSPSERAAANLVCIGGPKTNSLTKDLFADQTLHCSYEPEANCYVLKDKKYGNDGVPNYDGHFVDHGVLAKVPSPWRSGREVIVIAGVSDRGGEGISQLLRVDDPSLAELGDYFVSIVKTEHKDGAYFGAKICDTQGL